MPSTQQLNYKDPVAGRVHKSIPVISGRHLTDGDWQILVPAARESCQEHGFLCVQLDDRQQQLVDTSFAAMQAFFAVDDAIKSTVSAGGGKNGWTPSYQEPAYQPGTVSNVESFDISQSLIDAPDDRKWPDEDVFQRSACTCWDELLAISDRLLELIGLTLGMSPDFLPTNCGSRELNTLRFLHYPAADGRVDAHEVGIAAHTDFECITVLYQTAPGLEIRNVRGAWLEVPADRGNLIVLLGDMLEVWSNGRIQATGHRVRRTDEERFSIVMFNAVNRGLQVEPLPQFVSAQKPVAYLPIEQEAHMAAEIAMAVQNLNESAT